MQNIPACQYLHGKETVKIYENFFTCSRPPKRPAEGTITPQGQTLRRERKAANGIKTGRSAGGGGTRSPARSTAFPHARETLTDRKRERQYPLPFHVSCKVLRLRPLFVRRAEPQDAARKDGRKDQPDRSQRDEHIDDDRADRAVPHEDGGHKVEIEDAVQPPIHRAQQHEDIRNKIGYEHKLPPSPIVRRFLRIITASILWFYYFNFKPLFFSIFYRCTGSPGYPVI